MQHVTKRAAPCGPASRPERVLPISCSEQTKTAPKASNAQPPNAGKTTAAAETLQLLDFNSAVAHNAQ